MNRILFASFTLFAFAFVACQSDNSPGQAEQAEVRPSAEENPAALAGQWINLDFCSRSNTYGSVLETQKNSHKPYAYAFEILPAVPDSIICFDGVDMQVLPLRYNQDTLEIVGANNGKSIYMVYHSQKEEKDRDIDVFDATSGTVKMDHYIKSNAGTRDASMAFATALNHHLFNGIMMQPGKKDTIQFTPGGFILKWGPYDRYRVCTGGDCFLAGNNADMVTLYNSEKPGVEKTFAFRYNLRKDTLYLHNVPPAEPGLAKVGPVAYTFWRSPAM